MREILFRGKKKINDEWIYGYYFQKQNVYAEDGNPIKHCISDLPPFGAEIVLETVGQYTGLTDKNGTKIFDGDIVVFNRGRKLPNTEVKPEAIFWDEKNAQFARYVEYVRCGKLFYAALLLQKDMMPECEVIGNIYDNPELLKGGVE